MFKLWLVSCGLFVAALAAESIAPLQPKPDKYQNQKGCYISELNTVLPVGKSAASKNACYQYVCGENYVTIQDCGVAHTVPPCSIVEDKKKPYPLCCPKIECPQL